MLPLKVKPPVAGAARKQGLALAKPDHFAGRARRPRYARSRCADARNPVAQDVPVVKAEEIGDRLQAVAVAQGDGFGPQGLAQGLHQPWRRQYRAWGCLC
jgi:hypothetical protein